MTSLLILRYSPPDLCVLTARWGSSPTSAASGLPLWLPTCHRQLVLTRRALMVRHRHTERRKRCSVFSFLRKPTYSHSKRAFLLSLCLLGFFLSAVYIAAFYSRIPTYRLFVFLSLYFLSCCHRFGYLTV